MNTGEYKSYLGIIWDTMMCVLFGDIIVQRLQEVQIGMQLTWIDWVLVLLCVINLIFGAMLLFSRRPVIDDSRKLSNKTLWIGGLLTLVVFVVVLLAIADISNALTDIIIILATLLYLFLELWLMRQK